MGNEITIEPNKQTASAPVVSDAQGILAVISRAALDPNTDIDKMERLLQMQERIMANQAEAEFNRAMSKMQNKMPVVTKRGEITVNNVVRSRYAKFEDINDAAKPVLQKHGFSMSFRTEVADGAVKVTGILAHAGGHREQTELALPVDMSGSKNSVQGVGSSIEYGKRYVMCAILNIVTKGADDDGNTAGVELLSEEQIANLDALLEETGSDKEKFLTYITGGLFKATSLGDIPVTLYDKAVSALEAARKLKSSHGNSQNA